MDLKSFACFSLIDFSLDESALYSLSVNEMLSIISSNIKLWNRAKIIPNPKLSEIINDFKIELISHTCEQEDVGISEHDIVKNIMSCSSDNMTDNMTDLTIKILETKNLIKAYELINGLTINKFRFLDLDHVLDLHATIMRDLPTAQAGGKISIKTRKTSWRGKTHEYPKFQSETDGENRILTILDRYNAFTIRDIDR